MKKNYEHVAEVNKLEELGKFTVIERKAEMDPIPFIEVLTDKIDNISGLKKYKVRLAARGDLVEKVKGKKVIHKLQTLKT